MQPDAGLPAGIKPGDVTILGIISGDNVTGEIRQVLSLELLEIREPRATKAGRILPGGRGAALVSVGGDTQWLAVGDALTIVVQSKVVEAADA